MSNPHPKPQKLAMGPLSGKGTQAHYNAQRFTFDIPQRVTNSSSKAPYSAKSELTYRGQGVRHESKGGC